MHYRQRIVHSGHFSGLLVLLLLFPWGAAGATEEEGIFGPETYVRETGAPQTFEASFARCGSSDCRLVIRNGDTNGENRVSSASIALNGDRIVGPRDFNQNVGGIVRPISTDAENDLSIRMASNPSGAITVEVRCDASAVDLVVGGSGVDLADPSTLRSALRIANEGSADALNLELTDLLLTDGTRSMPASLPQGFGTLAEDEAALLDAEFQGSFAPRGTHTLTAEGTYEADGETFCFALDSELQIPPAAPGSAPLLTTSVPSQTNDGAPFDPVPPQDEGDLEGVNEPLWVVPRGPFVPGDPTETATAATPAPLGAGSEAKSMDPAAPAYAKAGTVVFEANVGGINGGSVAPSSSTAEPSGASDGDGVVFATGNWFAALSTGGGAFTPINPTSVFPSDTVGFCCDQLVQYVPKIDRFVWLLQGSTGSGRLGGYRLAAISPSALASGGASATWTYWNLTPTVFGQPAGTGFDYPDMSVGNNYLYLGWDAGFGCPSGCAQGFQVVRVPLDEIQAGGTINLGFTNPTDGRMAWGAHIAQNPGTEVFWAGHNNNSEMRVFTMAEGSGRYFWRDVGISTWARRSLTSTTPDGLDWMDKLSGFPSNSVHGLTRNGNHLWMSWSAGTDDNFPRSHIEMVTLDQADGFAKERQVQIWNPDFEFGYPALATNACTGEIGLSLEYGGNGRYGNHAVGFWGDFLVYRTTSSNVGTKRFGDYVAIRREPADEANPGNLFAAFGYGLNKTTSGGTRTDMHYVSFGRPAAECQILF